MNNDGPNWAKLVIEGRCFAHGIPWTEEQAVARSKGIPAQFVREGCLTLEDYEVARKKIVKIEKETGEKPLDHMTLDELRTKADSLGIKYTKAATQASLEKTISKKLEQDE